MSEAVCPTPYGTTVAPVVSKILVVGIASYPETIVQTMDDRIGRAQSGSPEGPGGTFIHHLAIVVCQRDIERAARCTGGFVGTDQTFGCSGKITAKGRMFLLILPDLVFLGEREEWEIGQVMDSSTLDADGREFGLVEERRGPDIL